MFKIENPYEHFYIYKYENCRKWKKLYQNPINYKELIDFLVKKTYMKYDSEKKTAVICCPPLGINSSVNEYYFTNAANRKVNISDELIEEVVQEYKKRKSSVRYPPKHYSYYSFRYRIDPVPFVHKVKGGSPYRCPKIFRIKKDRANPEVKEFLRPIKTLPYWWDDKCECLQRSWKKQRKVRHQWQR